jgi:hypothetical protein
MLVLYSYFFSVPSLGFLRQLHHFFFPGPSKPALD